MRDCSGEGLAASACRVYICQHDADGMLTATRTAVPGVPRGGRGRGVSKVLRARAANTFKKRTRACVYIYYIHKAITGV